MKQQISHISIHQSSKVFAMLYFLPMAVILIPAGILLLFTGNNSNALFCFAFPIFYLLIMYLFSSILLWIYNRIASYFGGIEFILTPIEKED